jgi:hypothetical protein
MSGRGAGRRGSRAPRLRRAWRRPPQRRPPGRPRGPGKTSPPRSAAARYGHEGSLVQSPGVVLVGATDVEQLAAREHHPAHRGQPADATGEQPTGRPRCPHSGGHTPPSRAAAAGSARSRTGGRAGPGRAPATSCGPKPTAVTSAQRVVEELGDEHAPAQPPHAGQDGHQPGLSRERPAQDDEDEGESEDTHRPVQSSRQSLLQRVPAAARDTARTRHG